MKRAVLLCLCCVMFLFSACKKSPPSPEAPEGSKKIEQEKAEVPELPGDVSSNGDSGEGTGPDYAEAVKRCHEAAEQGHAFAQSNLGLMYANGFGVQQDYIEAYKWILLAGVNGHYDDQVITMLETQMKSSEMEQGRQLAQEHFERSKREKESSGNSK